LVLFYVPASMHAETKIYRNLGFLEGNIWYSKDPFFAGDTIRIYSAVYNSSPNDLLGTVEFYDYATSLGSMAFSVAGGGKVQDAWVDWVPSKGQHKILARITNAKISLIGGKEESITISSSESGSSERFVDTHNEIIPQTVEVKEITKPLAKESEKISSGGSIASSERVNTNAIATLSKNIILFSKQTIDTNAKRAEAALRPVLEKTKKMVMLSDGNGASISTDDVLKKPLDFSYFLALSLVAYILKNKILLYILAALVLFKILYISFRKLFRI